MTATLPHCKKTGLTFASWDVAEFLHDVFVHGEAPRPCVNVFRCDRIAAVVANVVEFDCRINRVIGEVLHIVVRMRVRPLLAPLLTLNARYGTAHLTNISFTPGSTQTFNVEKLPSKFF